MIHIIYFMLFIFLKNENYGTITANDYLTYCTLCLVVKLYIIFIVQASEQLLEAVQQKVQIAEQLEQWESDIHTVIGKHK